MDGNIGQLVWAGIILLTISTATAQNRPAFYNPGDENAVSTAMSTIEHLLRNDELECLPRLLCEYAAGGKPGQARAVNVDIKSLFTLLQYLGLDQSNTASPMLSLAKSVTLGLTHRGDSYECYRSYPRCPRDQTRLLYYLNNHRGGFFRGFGGYYHRNANEDHKSTKPGESDSRIVNNKFAHNIASIGFPPYANDEIYSNAGFFSNNPAIVFTNNDIDSTTNSISNKPEFVFSNDYRRPKELGVTEGMDRLPSRLYFPPVQESIHGYHDIGSSFFPQS